MAVTRGHSIPAARPRRPARGEQLMPTSRWAQGNLRKLIQAGLAGCRAGPLDRPGLEDRVACFLRGFVVVLQGPARWPECEQIGREKPWQKTTRTTSWHVISLFLLPDSGAPRQPSGGTATTASPGFACTAGVVVSHQARFSAGDDARSGWQFLPRPRPAPHSQPGGPPHRVCPPASPSCLPFTIRPGIPSRSVG
jgi:hypothetical protein